MKTILLFVLTILFSSCDKISDENQIDQKMEKYSTTYTSLADIQSLFEEYASIVSESERDSAFNVLLDSMKLRNHIPFAEGNNALLIYYGSATKVAWAGDFSGWSSTLSAFQGQRVGESKLFTCLTTFPTDARLDYKIVVNGNSWMLDNRNNFIQYSGFGPNSELRMPDWKMPDETALWEGTTRGNFSDNIRMTSISLGYDIQYKVYTPQGYNTTNNLPVLYVTDGHEYADDRLGAMLIVLDNLISRGHIEPVMAVFIDPRNPDNLGQNRRAEQYRSNPLFVKFVTSELIPLIDSQYKTNPKPESRVMVGTSYGGWNAAYFGLQANDYFGNLLIHSPAFQLDMPALYDEAGKLPLRIYLSTGTINDTEDRAIALKTILEKHGYDFQYKAVHQGHSWGNWRNLIDEPLVFFFGKK